MAESSQSNNNVSQFNRFLNNNTTFIHQKYDRYFEDSFSLALLKTQPKLENTLQFIYDIFSFKKYQSNPKLNNTLRSSLSANISQFIEEIINSEYNSNTPRLFDKSTSIELLKYCIENNDMFAVHYDKKNPQKNKENQEKVTEKQQNNQPEPPKNEEQKVSTQQQLNNQESKPIVEEENKQKQIQNQSKDKDENDYVSQKQVLTETVKGQNTELIKKQLKGVFDFYCKQQQNVGPKFTFDTINHKCQAMNIGKFMTFAKAANLLHSKSQSYSEAKIDKEIAITTFKRLAQGHRQIDFRIFLAIMEDLRRNDQCLYERMGLGQEGAKGKNKLLERLKYIVLPFSTRDPEGREKSPHGKVFIPKLTTHSGKIEQALRDELVSRKERPYMQSIDKMNNITKFSNYSNKGVLKGEETNDNFTFKLGQPNEGKSDGEDLQFLSKLITHQQNDDIFLKDYQIPARKNANSHKQKTTVRTFDQGGRYKQEMQESVDKSFTKNQGNFTTRPKNKEDLILPQIKSKGLTGIMIERRSLGVKKLGSRHLE